MKIKLSFSLIISFLLLLIWLPFPQEVAAQDNGFFEDDSPVRFTLSADFKKILESRYEKEYHPGMLSYSEENGNPVFIPVEIRTRGNYRLAKQNCDFPPLKLNFDKKTIAGTLFEGQKEFKLVTHCSNRQKLFEEYLLQEYLVYRAYEQLTEYSFHSRLALVTYVDSSGQTDIGERFGILIEDVDRLAKRMGGKEVEVQYVHQDSTDYQQITLVALFQYMIGNTDWSVPGLHNIKLISSPEPGARLIPVPFDFDHAGVISTYYAKPDPRLPIESVEERLYRGFWRPVDSLAPELDRFRKAKAAIFSEYEAFPYLKEKVIRRMLKYYDRFYGIINDPKAVEREFIRNCRRSLAE